MNAARAHASWRMLPFASLNAIVGPGAPLILAPHQDDESLGCGGLIAACAARGTKPVVAFLKKFQWKAGELDSVMLAIQGGAKPDAAATQWISQHGDRVKSWTDGAQ